SSCPFREPISIRAASSRPPSPGPWCERFIRAGCAERSVSSVRRKTHRVVNVPGAVPRRSSYLEGFMRRPHRRILGSLLVLLSALAASAAAQDKPQDKQPEGAQCRGCHEDKLPKFDRTPHAGATESCLSCHK